MKRIRLAVGWLTVWCACTLAQTPLTLKDAVQRGVSQHPEIQSERLQVASERQGIKLALGQFDAKLKQEWSWRKSDTPTGSLLESPTGKIKERAFNHRSALEQALPRFGTQLTLSYETNRTANNNPFLSLNPFFTSRWQLEARQPLWRNRRTDAARTELIIRRQLAGLAETEFETRLLDFIGRIEQAYWTFATARQTLAIAADAVALAVSFKDSTVRQVNAGELARAEIAAAESELQRRQDMRLAQQAQVAEAENALKQLLATQRNDALWQESLTLNEPLTDPSATLPNLDETITTALQKRPELRALTQRLDLNETEQRLLAEQRKPQLDLTMTYGVQGLAGSLNTLPNPFGDNDAVPPALRGGWGKSLAQTGRQNYPTVQIGLTLELPLRNRTADARLAQNEFAAQRLTLQRAQIEQAIIAQIRNALAALESARQRIGAANLGTQAAQERLSSETRLYANGESTSYFVLTRQNEFAEARRRLALAQLDGQMATARLAQATGLTLQRYQVSLQ